MLRVLDTDHDRALSSAEMDDAPLHLRALDRNHDGALGARECGFRLGFGSSGPARYMRAHPIHRVLEANGDQVISAEEIDSAAERLRRLDSNRDGKLDVQELLRP